MQPEPDAALPKPHPADEIGPYAREARCASYADELVDQADVPLPVGLPFSCVMVVAPPRLQS